MRRRTALPLALVLISLLTLPSSFAAAVDDPARGSSEYWLEKLVDYYADSAPYSLVYAMEMSIVQQGTTLSIAASGDLLYAGPERMRSEIDMTMAMEMLPEPVQMSVLVVHDGEVIWTEMENPMAGGKQVMKVSADAARQIQAGVGGNLGGDQLDPGAQVKMLAEMMDFAVVAGSDGEVRLEGTLTGEGKAKLGPAAQFFGQDGPGLVVLTLDEKTGALRRLTMGDSAQPTITMSYQDLKRVSKGELGPDAFLYIPPEGVPVQDLTQSVRDAQAGNERQEPAPVQ